jgi:Ca-activated chloride channel family protein
MQDENKLPLLKKGMALLAQTLKPQDRIGIVTYCTSAQIALESASGDQKDRILSVLNSLSANGSTNGWDGIQWAYDMAARHFIERGVNRVILCTDGDFNVGPSDTDNVTRMIQDKAKSGVFLSVLGFGQGNLQDDKLEALADKGNGHYAYIDSFSEARRVLLDKITGTLFTIAKDVKIQVEFNPIRVGAYRLIGYENRTLAAKDFNNDQKDAGEIGADHRVTALYELVPPGQPIAAPGVDPLKYQERETAPQPTEAAGSGELMTVKLRYKRPDGDTSVRTDIPIPASADTEASGDFRFAAGVAAFGMLLRNSEYRGGATFEQALNLAQQGKGPDPEGRRAEFINLIRTAQALAGETPRRE